MAKKKVNTSELFLKESYFEGCKMAVVDVETTGLTNEDEIIQFSGIVVDIKTWTVLEECSFYINIGRPLPDIIVNLTGITDQTLQSEGITRDEAARKVRTFIESATICGHNVNFDIKKIQHLFDDVGMVYNMEDHKIVDTMSLARAYYPKSEVGNHKLGNLVETFELDDGLSFHNAIDDVIATMRLCKYIFENKINPPVENLESTTKEVEKVFSAEIDEKKFKKNPLPYIPKFPERVGGTPIVVTKVARWKKSIKMDRIYIDFDVYGRQGQIYFDMCSCMYVDIDGNYVDTIDMQSLQVQVCDLLWSNGFSGYDDFDRILLN